MSTIVISYDGNDITDDVVLSEATFTSQVNGLPGPCSFKVRDPNRDKSFTTGKPLTLTIDGEAVWTGYLMSVSRVYAFADHSPQTRLLLLQGTDINVLLHRRFIFNQSTPTKMFGPTYAVGTADTTAIDDLVSDWLDLSGDSLDTSTLVDHVGAVNIDQKANLWEAGWEWNSAMATIARLTQAIWYIDPDRNLVFTDVDTTTAAVELSDTPSGGRVGYRQFSLDFNGSQMINDALIWGVGGGSPTAVFKRLEDSSSESAHNRWQYGGTYTGVYKQATVDSIANSIVNGSPLSKRGAKNDRVSVELTTFEQSFLPAQKVNVFSNTFGWSDVIPIRKMEVTFPNPTTAKFHLTLSHEIDLPFNPFDLVPIIPFGGGGGFSGWPPPGIEIPGGCDCGIFDDFTRTVASPSSGSTVTVAGTPTAGAGFQYFGTLGDFHFPPNRQASITVDGSQLVYVTFKDYQSNPVQFYQGGRLDLTRAGGVGTAFLLPVDYYFTIELIDMPAADPAGSPYFGFVSNLTIRTGHIRSGQLEFFVDGRVEIRGLDGNTGITPGPNVSGFDHTGVIDVHIRQEAHDFYANAWHGGAEPAGWLVHDTISSAETDGILIFFINGSHQAPDTPFTLNVDNLSIFQNGVPIDLCTEGRFDNFERTVSNAWGTSTFGTAWTIGNVADASDFSVDGTQGRISHPSGSPQMSVSGSTDPWKVNNIWTMSCMFHSGTLTGGLGNRDDLVFKLSNGAELDVRLALATDATGYIDLNGDQVAFNTENSTWYYLKWYYERLTGITKAKVWKTIDAEPDWLLTHNDGGDFGAATSFLVRMANKNPSGLTYVILFDYIDFDYVGKPCYDSVFPAPSSDQSSTSAICENGTSNGSDTVYTLFHPYVYGSVYFWLDGYLQTNFTQDDPNGGVITFDSPPAAGTIRICYDIATETGGHEGGLPPRLL